MRALILLSLSSLAWSWGYAGHRLISHLAYTQLTPTTQQKISHILGGGERRFVASSTWADQIRPRYRHWHYATLSKTNSPLNQGPGRLYFGLRYSLNHLKNPHSQSQKTYLRLFIHLVEDAHQPLHVGQNKDRGGNFYWIRVNHRKENLHHLWDTHIILYLLQHPKVLNQTFANKTPTSFEDWIRHSRALHQKIYPKERHCPRSSPCLLSEKYLETHAAIAAQQIKDASYHLAWQLNQLYDKGR